jgi:hypothetical protein
MDTAMASPLFHLPDEGIHLFVDAPMPHIEHQLAVRTLLRGAATKLPSGQQVRTMLCPNEAVIPQVPDDVANRYDYHPWANAERLGLAEHTPLWYYILLEAQIESRGLTLGTVGSRLVAEVIEGALQNAPHSYVTSCASDWTPPPWKAGDGKLRELRSLRDVARFVGLAA